MSLIADWEKIIVRQERSMNDKIRRIVRLKQEVSQKQAEIKELNNKIKNHEIIITKAQKEQWKEEDKAINKLRKQGEFNSKLQTSGVICGPKGTKKTHSKR